MKKLTIVFAFVLLCFTAQAQTNADLFGGKWVLDVDETIAVDPHSKKQFEELSESDQAQTRAMLASTYMEFNLDGTMSVTTFGTEKKGTYKIKGKTLTTILDSTSVMNIQSFENDVLVVNKKSNNQESIDVAAFKRTKE